MPSLPVNERERELVALRQWERSHSQVIPANPGYHVVVFWFRHADDPKTFYIFGNLERFPVEAWRIRGEAMVPMNPALSADVRLDTQDNEDCIHAVVEPSGRVFDGVGQRWDTVEEWTEHVREQWLAKPEGGR